MRYGNVIVSVRTPTQLDVRRIRDVLAQERSYLLIVKRRHDVFQFPTIVSHRLFSLDRRNPTRVHLRVLNRMANKAGDPYAQYDRIKDAFRLAEWSEDEFNNRNLFSDYFLKNRLRDKDLFPVFQKDVGPAQRELSRILTQAGDVRTLKPEQTNDKLIKPLMAALGFETPKPARGQHAADYLLEAKKDSASAKIALLVYPWDRSLDRKDDRDPDRPEDVPGIRVVKALEHHGASWAILTNGKDWRLYSAAAHSRASNYYEVDLPETLEREDLTAFRYFYLFFRAAAFVPVAPLRDDESGQPACFLDHLRADSAAFAKEVGDRLRDHIFKEVFPYLAQGFVEYRKKKHGETTKAGDPFLDEVYDATLTLLYRLLFLLYAESLDLVPVHEPAYAAVSLTKLKEEIAKAAGSETDAVEKRLKDRFNQTDTKLYRQLGDLFKIIDEGSKDHNVPAYNGGLFETSPQRTDRSREAAAARFLKKHRVPDYFLARALDLLARSEDAKSHALVFVDYKALGVRQLGNIYEGLLVYHVVIPSDDWEKGLQRKGLRVALVPSNKERKSSGSYFTPQHIVKYIVANTVGPLLTEKFEALAPKLRPIQREYQETREFERKRAEKMRSQPRTDDAIAHGIAIKHEKTVWDVFDLKVLDPAMGSGHFLVETVDFITDKVLDFLAGFPWNPVQVLIDQRIRAQIIESLDDQGVKINEDRLTDVNLIKRLVMKRCVYGVDLNPMAVELAKVSLWLDSFTLGAPLSFMDHHLKCGNSLIGATIADLKKASEGWMYGIPMEPLERATRNMEDIADLTDATLAEVTKSAETYEKVVAGVEGYRALLDCLTAEHFGVKGASHLITEGSDLDLEHWSKTVESLERREQGWIKKATGVSHERQFFHWDIDFPDVFFTRRRTEELRAFDAIVGNPPYDELSAEVGSDTATMVAFFRSKDGYKECQGGHLNLFELFICRAHHVAHPSSRHSFIVPMRLLADSFASDLRSFILKTDRLYRVDAFPQKDDASRRVFFDAKLSTVVYAAELFAPPGKVCVATHPWARVQSDSPRYSADALDFLRLTPSEALIPIRLDNEAWRILQNLEQRAGDRRLAEAGRWASGEIMEGPTLRPYLTTPDRGVRLTRGGNVSRYEFKEEPKQGEKVYVDLIRLRSERSRSLKLADQEKPRIAFQESSAVDNYRRIIATALPRGTLCGKKLSYLCDANVPLESLLALLNSALIEWRFSSTSTTNSLSLPEVARLPFIASPNSNKGFQKLGEHAGDCCRLGAEKEKLRAKFKTELRRCAESNSVDDWTGSTKLRDLDYLGWGGRYPAWKPGETTAADGRWFSNGVAPSIDGTGPGDIPFDLIARVYPSYPLPGIDHESWEAGAWEDLCDLLRKNKSKIGNDRIRADLTGRGAINNPTGRMRKLQETFFKYHRSIRENRAKAAEIDFLIDRIVFRLFDLTLDEQKLILSRVGPGRPLPPRRGRRKRAAGKKKPDLTPTLFD